MRYITFAFFAALFYATSTLLFAQDGLQGDIAVTPSSPEQDLHPGDIGLVDTTTVVRVLNKKKISNGIYTFSYGSTCFIDQRAIVTMLDVYDKDRVLLRLDDTESSGSSLCPGKKNVVFLLDRARFAAMKQMYANREPIAALLQKHGIE